MELRYPWVTLRDPKGFEAQLSRELPPGHVLTGIPVQALAREDGSDDVLFDLLDGTGRVAVVHLTFSKNISPEWPRTEIFRSQQEWAAARMQRDAGETDA